MPAPSIETRTIPADAPAGRRRQTGVAAAAGTGARPRPSRALLLAAAALAAGAAPGVLAPEAAATVVVDGSKIYTDVTGGATNFKSIGAATVTDFGAGGVPTLVAGSELELKTAETYYLTIGSQLVIDEKYAGTFTGKFLSMTVGKTGIEAETRMEELVADNNPDAIGIITITGDRELEYRGWQDVLNNVALTGSGGFYRRMFFPGRQPTYIDKTDATTPLAMDYPSFAGTIKVEGKTTLKVAGYLNQYSARGEIAGLGRLVLNDESTLSFQNSQPNITREVLADEYGSFDAVMRFNLIKNVESTTSLTSLQTGLDDYYRVYLYMDETYDGSMNPDGTINEGGVGFLRGKGIFIKGGPGQFNIKNDGDFTGGVVLSGGITKLSSTGGRALETAYTVNLATFGTMGGIPGATVGLVTSGGQTIGVSYVPVSPFGVGMGTAVDATDFYSAFGTILGVSTDQTIHNFQTWFTRAEGADEVVASTGSGAGSAIYLMGFDAEGVTARKGTILTVIQDASRDGLYEGALVGVKDSVFLKKGPGTIALMGNYDPEDMTGMIDIQEGRIIANVGSLGSGIVRIGAAGELLIVQNNSGTFATTLMGNTGGELIITVDATITNEAGGWGVGDSTQVGVAHFIKSQPEFYGTLVAKEGVHIMFAPLDIVTEDYPDDCFINAHSIRLEQGTYYGGRATMLEFADTNQKLNNFVGDPKTRIDLGRGTATLRQINPPSASNNYNTYQGIITGAGNLILLTDTRYTFSGDHENLPNLEDNTYFGATVVKPYTDSITASATLYLGSSSGDTVKNSSALILYRGATMVSAVTGADGTPAQKLDDDGQPVISASGQYVFANYKPQHFGALFGEVGSRIDMGDAMLTIGTDKTQIRRIVDELAGKSTRSPSVQAAYYFSTTVAGDKPRDTILNPLFSDFTIGYSVYYLETLLRNMTEWKELLYDSAGNPIYEDNGEQKYTLHGGRGLSNAADLAYAGTIEATGARIAINAATAAANGYTVGTVITRAGDYYVDTTYAASLSSAPVRTEIPYYVLQTDAGAIELVGPALVKIGDQRLTLTGTNPYFTGGVHVRDGYLRIYPDSLPNAAFIQVDLYKSDIAGDVSAEDLANYGGRPAQVELNVPSSRYPVTDPLAPAVLTLESLITGSGDVAKIGDGTMRLANYVHTGNTRVKEGALILPARENLGDIWLGDVVKNGNGVVTESTHGTIVFEVAAGESITYTGSIRDNYTAGTALTRNAYGNVTKTGDGTLIIDGDAQRATGTTGLVREISYHGTTSVLQGELIFAGHASGGTANVPPSDSKYTVAAGATLAFDIPFDVPAPSIEGDLSGSGTLRKLGAGTLTINRTQNDFLGDVRVSEGDLSLEVKHAFASAGVLEIEDGARVFLNGHNQIFQNLSSPELDPSSPAYNPAFDPASKQYDPTLTISAHLILGTASITFLSLDGQSKTYVGTISGDGGEIVKEGRGELILRGSNAGDFSGSFRVNNGVLDTTVSALGSSNIAVAAKGTLKLYSANTAAITGSADAPFDKPFALGAADRYDGLITENGEVFKTGPGVVYLAWEEPTSPGQINTKITVSEGVLVIDSGRNGTTGGAHKLPYVFLENGTALQINLQANRMYYGALVNSTASATITGGGDLILDGQGAGNTLVFDYSIAYAGVTRLRNTARIDVSALKELPGGLAADKTSVVDFGTFVRGENFYITQRDFGTFEGQFVGAANLEFNGAGIFNYAGPDGNGDLSGYDGTIYVNGGNLQLGVRNSKEITLKSNIVKDADGNVLSTTYATLYINVRDEIDTDGDGILDDDSNDNAVTYRGVVTGDGNIVKTGPGDYTTDQLVFLANDASATTDRSLTIYSLTAAEGKLTITPGSLAHGTVGGDVKLAATGTGRLVWDAGDEIINSATGAEDPATRGEMQTGILTGDGAFEKIGTATLVVRDQPLFKGEFIVAEGGIAGSFALGAGDGSTGSTTGADLTIKATASLSPGNTEDAPIGTVTVRNFNLEKNAHLHVQISPTATDTVYYGLGAAALPAGEKASAVIAGAIHISTYGVNEDGTPFRPERGTLFNFVKPIAGLDATRDGGVVFDDPYIVDDDSEALGNNNYYVLVGPGLGTGTAYAAYAANGPAILVAQKRLAAVPGLEFRPGLEQLLAQLDKFATLQVTNAALTAPAKLGPGATPAEKAEYLRTLADYEATVARYAMGALLNTTTSAALPSAIANFSALGYGSMFAMPARVVTDNYANLRERLEQRRYDIGETLLNEDRWQFHIAGTDASAEFGSKLDAPNYKFYTRGGSVGADRKLGDYTFLGVSVNYAYGRASFTDGGGNLSSDLVQATAYFSQVFTPWFYMDAGLGGGLAYHTAHRDTLAGRNVAKPEGWNAGGFINFGTILTPAKGLFITPYVGAEYQRYETEAFTETSAASVSTLRVLNAAYDSLRLKVGTGVTWRVEAPAAFAYSFDSFFKIGVDFAFFSEILDRNADLTYRFSLMQSDNIDTAAPVAPQMSLRVSPNITYTFSKSTAVFASYAFESGFDGERYHRVTAGFRVSF
ncbi:MAG: autotransporter domain-containing protein [Puniceicoccales bacterium]|jgi:autotransporter-associated beta strand protein|nr:autotransporter domain-containing protein [Puniceicoccales bacterium]